MCKRYERFGFGVVALATRVTTYPFPLNVSAKTFTLYSHVSNNVLYAKLQIAHYLQQVII